MPGLTTREATRIEEGLHLEETLIAKFGTCASQVTDPECRRILMDIQALHQRHYDILRQQVDAALGLGATTTAAGVGQTAGIGPAPGGQVSGVGISSTASMGR